MRARCITLGTAAMLILCLTAFPQALAGDTGIFCHRCSERLIAGVVLALCWRHLSAIATGFATIAHWHHGGLCDLHHLPPRQRPPSWTACPWDGISGGWCLPISIGALTTIAAFLVMAGSPMRGYPATRSFRGDWRGVFGGVRARDFCRCSCRCQKPARNRRCG